MFVDGVIAVDCCTAPIWRQDPEEEAVQLFSDVFHYSPEHYVFKKGHRVAIPIPDALAGLRVAIVRGFNYQFEDKFGETVAVRDMEDVLDMLVAERADVAMINQQDFYRRMRLKPRPLELGDTHFIADLRVRVHKDHAALLPAINAAIARLKQNGRIAALLQDVLGVSEVPGTAAVTAAGPLRRVMLTVGQSDSVGFHAAWRAILEEAGIDATFISVPPERKRRLFVEGAILLDCCAAPIWRVRPQEVAVQRWSETFYLTREQYVFLKGQVVDIADQEMLATMRVATVAGFEYQDRAYFGVEVPGRNLGDVLKLLFAGRADVGIISNVDFIALTKATPDRFELGGVRVRAQQKVRVHRMVDYLLPRINDAITRLNSDGRLIELLENQ